jgi:hypothetical protein
MSGVTSASLSDAQANQILDIVRQQLQLVLTSPTRVQPGQPVTAALVPSTPVLDVSELANGVLNLAWAAKDVLFNTPNPVEVPTPTELTSPNGLDGDEVVKAAGSIFGKQPFPPPLPGGTVTSQTSGVSAQLFGTFSPPQLKIAISIRWRVRDPAGNEFVDGDKFIATQGLTSPAVLLLILPPLLREYRLDTLLNPGGSVVCLSAEVTLRLEAKTLPFTLGPVPILLLPLLIPTVVVLFSEPTFGLTHESAVLIVVPEHSPFTSAEPLFKTLKSIEAAVSALRGLGGLVSFFLGLDDLLSSVPDQPRLRFAAARLDPDNPGQGQGIRRLGDIIVKRRPWYDFLGDDPNFDDVVYSLIIFGLPGTKVQFFNDTNFKMNPETTQGNFDIELRNSAPDLDFFVAVRTLDTDDDRAPETFPANRVPRFEGDPSGDDRWHTDMSSLRFDKGWLSGVEEEIKNPKETPPITCIQRRPPTPGHESES